MKKALIIALLLSGLAACADPLYDTSNEAKLEYNQGVDYYKAGKLDRSIMSFRRAIELDPNYVDAYYNLGSILEYTQKNEEALTVFKQIMVRKPDDYESVFKAANLSSKLGQNENAKKYLSLIPPESPIYSKAQSLANSMGTDLQTIKADIARAAEIEAAKSANQSNGMYNNLPSPTGIAGDRYGNIYVACFSDNMIYKITPDGKRIIFVKDSRINGPIALVSDETDNIYVSNYNGNNVIKITPAGNISTVISNVQKPYGMSLKDGLLFVSSQGSNSVLRYKL
jgi:tetratricopeptide (TPR) repeat protein